MLRKKNSIPEEFLAAPDSDSRRKKSRATPAIVWKFITFKVVIDDLRSRVEKSGQFPKSPFGGPPLFARWRRGGGTEGKRLPDSERIRPGAISYLGEKGRPRGRGKTGSNEIQ